MALSLSIHKKYFLLAAMAVSFVNCCKAQFPAIDSIKKKIAAAENRQEALKQIQQLLLYRNSLNGDSMMLYAEKGKILALQLFDASALAWCEYYLLAGELAKGKTDSITFKIENGPLHKTDFKKERALYFKTVLLKANVLNRLDERVKALDLQIKLLDEAERENNIKAQAFILNYIGATYLNISKPDDARANWMKGLAVIQQNPSVELKEIEAVINSNLVLFYYNKIQATNKQAADSFLVYANVTETICRKHGVYSTLATVLALKGNYYGGTGDFVTGEKKLQEAVDIRNRIGDPLYIMNDMTNLAAFYYYQKQYDKSIAVTNDMLRLAGENHIVADKQGLIALMSAAYKGKGDFKKYSEALERFILFSDSSAKINAAEKIAEVEERFKVQKNEALIANQKLELFRKNIFISGGATVTILAAITGVVFFRRYRLRQKIKTNQAVDKERLQKNIAVKEAEEKERKRIAAELHDNMGVQASAILHISTMFGNEQKGNEVLIANLQATAREMLGNLRETVWALKATETGTAETWFRIVNFVKQMQRLYPTVHFNLNGEAPAAAQLPSVKALHIVLVIKEAVNNALKHSGADTITVSGSCSNSEWTIIVADNGEGFEMATVNNIDSNGLENMKQRAVSGNFLMAMNTTCGKGTDVTLTVNL
jgi:signal transduction histidine kinase